MIWVIVAIALLIIGVANLLLSLFIWYVQNVEIMSMHQKLDNLEMHQVTIKDIHDAVAEMKNA